jgi:flagellin-like hook-associated protein FlgL
MRVTFTTVNRNVQRNLSRRYADMVSLQEQLSTGKRLTKPSDNPVDVANDIKLRTKQTQLKQYKRNIEDGLAVMGVASSAMGSMNELLHRARELAVQAANGTYTDSDRVYMQQEVDQIFRQMMSVVNTQFKGNYVFNGTNTKTPPYIIATSDSELPDYINRSMATYGSELDFSVIDAAIDVDPASSYSIYLEYGLSKLKVGDTVQLKWTMESNPAYVNANIDGKALNNVFEDSFPLDTYAVDGQTFTKGHDYEVDYKNGKIAIITEHFRDALNSVLPADRVTKTGIGYADYTTSATNGGSLQYSMTNTFQIIGGKFGETIDNIFPGSLKINIGSREYIEGYGEFKGGYYEVLEDGSHVYRKGENEYDYSVDYESGKVTIHNMDLLRDMRPDWLIDPSNLNPPPNPDSMYQAGKLQLHFDYITRGTNIYGDKVASQGDILRAVEEGITIPINTRVNDLLHDRASGNEMVGVLLRYSQALMKDDRNGIQQALSELTNMYDATLNSQSQMGAKIYRLELTHERNGEQTVEVLSQQSALEDADLAEVISKLMLAENVYNAALQAAMRVIQPSLANYM